MDLVYPRFVILAKLVLFTAAQIVNVIQIYQLKEEYIYMIRPSVLVVNVSFLFFIWDF